MKKLLLGVGPRYRGLRRRLLVAARGVPADDLASLRWRKVLSLSASLLRIAVLFFILVPFFLTAFLPPNPFFEITSFALSLLLGFSLAESIGRRLIPPRDGQILVATPISDKMVWWLSLYWVPVQLPLIALGFLFLLASSGMNISQALAITIGWFVTPAACIALALAFRGRLTLLWQGLKVLLFVGLFGSIFFKEIPEVRRLLSSFDQSASLLPLNWFLQSIPGTLATLVIYSFAVGEWYRWRTSYRFRSYISMTPNLVRPIVAASKKVSSNEANRRKKGGLFCWIPQLLWNREERALGRALGYRFGAIELVLPFLAIHLIDLIEVPLDSLTDENQQPQILAGLIVLAIVGVISWRGWPDGSRRMVFYRLPCNGGRQVSVLGVFPISEGRAFVMSLKELAVGELVWIPIRLFLFWTLTESLNPSGEVIQFWPLLVFIIAGPTCFHLVGWTRALWQGVELFPDNLKGILLRGLMRYGYGLPLIAFAFALLVCGGIAMGEVVVTGWFFFFLFFFTLWIAGGLILLRRTFRLGKGSLIVKPASKSFSLQK